MAFRGKTLRHVFAGGWATDFGPTAEVAPSQSGLLQVPFLRDAENVQYTFDGGPQKIGGTTKFNSSALDPAGDGSDLEIRGLFDYWRQGTGGSPTNFRIVHVGTKVYNDANDASFVELDTGLEDDKIPAYATFDDKLLYMSDSTSDVPKVWDATTLSAWAASIPFTTVAFGAVHKNRFWCAGDAANPSHLYFSPLADESGVSGDWDLNGGFIQIDPGDGDRIVGIASHKDELWVFKGPYKGSIHRISGSSPTGGDPFSRSTFVEGLPCVAHNAIFRYRDDLGFMCCDGSVHSLAATAAFGDFFETALSRPIHEYIHLHLNPARLNRSWAVPDSGRGRVLIAVPADTSTDNNRILMMDYRFQNVRWSLVSALNGVGCTALANVVDTTDSNRPNVWVGGTDGFVRKMNQATKSIDGTTAISYTARTPHMNYGTAINMKTIYYGSVGIAPKGSSTLTFGWQRDDRAEQTTSISQSGGDVLAISSGNPASGAFTLGSSQLGGSRFVDRFASLEGEFRSIAYSFANSANNEDAEVHSFSATIVPGADSVEN